MLYLASSNARTVQLANSHILTYSKTFLDCYFHVMQYINLEIQGCSSVTRYIFIPCLDGMLVYHSVTLALHLLLPISQEGGGGRGGGSYVKNLRILIGKFELNLLKSPQGPDYAPGWREVL